MQHYSGAGQGKLRGWAIVKKTAEMGWNHLQKSAEFLTVGGRQRS